MKKSCWLPPYIFLLFCLIITPSLVSAIQVGDSIKWGPKEYLIKSIRADSLFFYWTNLSRYDSSDYSRALGTGWQEKWIPGIWLKRVRKSDTSFYAKIKAGEPIKNVFFEDFDFDQLASRRIPHPSKRHADEEYKDTLVIESQLIFSNCFFENLNLRYEPSKGTTDGWWGSAYFEALNLKFRSEVYFSNCWFGSHLNFGDSRFEEVLAFTDNCHFNGALGLDGSTFQEMVTIEESYFNDGIYCSDGEFQDTLELVNNKGYHQLISFRASFNSYCHIWNNELTKLDFEGSVFTGKLRIGVPSFSLDDSYFQIRIDQDGRIEDPEESFYYSSRFRHDINPKSKFIKLLSCTLNNGIDLLHLRDLGLLMADAQVNGKATFYQCRFKYNNLNRVSFNDSTLFFGSHFKAYETNSTIFFGTSFNSFLDIRNTDFRGGEAPLTPFKEAYFNNDISLLINDHSERFGISLDNWERSWIITDSMSDMRANKVINQVIGFTNAQYDAPEAQKREILDRLNYQLFLIKKQHASGLESVWLGFVHTIVKGGYKGGTRLFTISIVVIMIFGILFFILLGQKIPEYLFHIGSTSKGSFEDHISMPLLLAISRFSMVVFLSLTIFISIRFKLIYFTLPAKIHMTMVAEWVIGKVTLLFFLAFIASKYEFVKDVLGM